MDDNLLEIIFDILEVVLDKAYDYYEKKKEEKANRCKQVATNESGQDNAKDNSNNIRLYDAQDYPYYKNYHH